MSLLLFVVPFASFVVALLSFYLYRKYYAFRLFAKEGIPGPAPNWLFGNLADFADESCRHLVLPKWTKQYGKLFGYFEGSRPVLVTTDCDMVMQVFVKQFHNFHARKEIPTRPTSDADAVLNKSMIMADGEKWKRLRTISSPTFSTGKLRSLMPLMNKCQGDFMRLVDCKAASGEPFDIFSCFKLLTMDTIAESAFGIELNGAKEALKTGSLSAISHPLSKSIDDTTQMVFKIPFTVQIAMIVPEVAKLMHYIELLKTVFLEALTPQNTNALKVVSEEIEARKRNPHPNKKRQDLLQMMLDLESSADLAGMKALSNTELSGQSVLFMFAGYETSSNTLAISCALLADNPDAQERLIAEIEEANLGTQPDYDKVMTLPYLDSVVNETLRLFPITPLFVNRMAVEDTVVNGIPIPKGLAVLANVWSIHRDEEQWGPVDTELFHPDRFLDDYPTKTSRSEAAFMPFGFGPRICIGMRFALLEIKLALVNLLRKYRIEKTERKLTIKSGLTITPANGVHVKLIKRI